MYRRVLMLFSFAAFVCDVSGQVNVSVQVPPTGIMQKNQLWNILLVSTSDNPINVSVHLSLSGVNDNTPVMTATSRMMVLSKGAKQVTSKDAGPIQYNYYSSSIADRNPDGFLPVGNYLACYIVYLLVGDQQMQLAEDCVPVEVAPIAPPLLNMPEDNAVVETQYPQFSWIPPAPMQLFGNLSYDMMLVEVLPGQSSTEAIQKNFPVFNAGNAKTIFSNYPASLQPLDTSKVYAWRVIAKNNGQFAAQSEVWTFTIRKQAAPPLVPKNGNYILLQSGQSSGITTIEDNILGIKFYSFDKERETTIRFMDSKGAVVQEIQRKLVYGNNYMAFSLNRLFDKGKTYSIEITDLQGGKHRAFFSMQP